MRPTGEYRTCESCGTEFYAAGWQLKDTLRRQGSYCSVPCKNAGQGRRLRRQIRPGPIKHTAGYLLTWAPEHPRASRGRVFEHILVAERALGRFLEPGEQVHHVNGDKTDNRPENLQVLTNTEHQKLHNHLGKINVGVRMTTRPCDFCGQDFTRPTKRYALYCSPSCKTRALWRDGRLKSRPKGKK